LAHLLPFIIYSFSADIHSNNNNVKHREQQTETMTGWNNILNFWRC